MAFTTPNIDPVLLKVFSGEVLTAFQKKNIGLNYVKTRTIKNGKTAQFPVIGALNDETDVKQHLAGNEVEVTTIPVNERTITLERPFYTALFVDDFDQKILHFDLRGEIARQMGETLSTKIDKAIFQKVTNAVLEDPLPGQPSGTIVQNADTDNENPEIAGDALVESIFEMGAQFDAKDVPESGRVFITTPDNYFKIVQSSKAVNRDFTSGNGGIDSGRVFNIAGVKIVMSNHIPSTINVDLDGDGTAEEHKVKGLYFTPDIIGVLKLYSIITEATWQEKNFGWLLTARYAMGMGTLNPGTGGIIVA